MDWWAGQYDDNRCTGLTAMHHLVPFSSFQFIPHPKTTHDLACRCGLACWTRACPWPVEGVQILSQATAQALAAGALLEETAIRRSWHAMCTWRVPISSPSGGATQLCGLCRLNSALCSKLEGYRGGEFWRCCSAHSAALWCIIVVPAEVIISG